MCGTVLNNPLCIVPLSIHSILLPRLCSNRTHRVGCRYLRFSVADGAHIASGVDKMSSVLPDSGDSLFPRRDQVCQDALSLRSRRTVPFRLQLFARFPIYLNTTLLPASPLSAHYRHTHRCHTQVPHTPIHGYGY